MSTTSQNERVLARLKCGPLTALVAWRELHVLRLAARIHNLRAAGHDIRTTINRGNPHYAKYFLVKRRVK